MSERMFAELIPRAGMAAELLESSPEANRKSTTAEEISEWFGDCAVINGSEGRKD